MKQLKALLLSAICLISITALANGRTNSANNKDLGVLLLAHGGSQKWNDEVMKVAATVGNEVAVEVAFGMANRRSMQEAIDKLQSRGVKRIVAVPLFVSSHSSIITATQYLLGLSKTAPADLAIFAKMDHTHQLTSSDAGMGHNDGSTPVKARVPISMTEALNHDPAVAAILLEKANSISTTPANEVVILVAHGPVPEADNLKWLNDMKILADDISTKSQFKRIEYQTVRDDAAEPMRQQATNELRGRVEKAIQEGNKVLIVPLVLSYGGIESGIKKRLDGLSYSISTSGLLPHEKIAQWVKTSAFSK